MSGGFERGGSGNGDDEKPKVTDIRTRKPLDTRDALTRQQRGNDAYWNQAKRADEDRRGIPKGFEPEMSLARISKELRAATKRKAEEILGECTELDIGEAWTKIDSFRNGKSINDVISIIHGTSIVKVDAANIAAAALLYLGLDAEGPPDTVA